MTYAVEVEAWHYRIFHHAPQLFALSEETGLDFLSPFLNFARQANLHLDWRLHLHLLSWLMRQDDWRDMIDARIVKELMIAAVTRWSLQGLEHVSAAGLLVTMKCAPQMAVGIWKSAAVGMPHKVVITHLPLHHQPHDDSYFVSYQENSWDGAEWVALAN